MRVEEGFRSLGSDRQSAISRFLNVRTDKRHADYRATIAILTDSLLHKRNICNAGCHTKSPSYVLTQRACNQLEYTGAGWAQIYDHGLGPFQGVATPVRKVGGLMCR